MIPHTKVRPEPTPSARKALLYASDLQEAVLRLSSAWNTTQIEEALYSVQFWHDKISLAIKKEKE